MRVVVCGGGVGGLATALALEQAGADVTVIERDEARAGARALHVWPNGMRVLDQLGVARRLVPARPVTSRAAFRSRSGRLLAQWDLESLGEQLGAPTLGLAGDEIVDALESALVRTRLVTGRPAISYDADDRGVTLRLEDRSVERGDVLVGADGARSFVAARVRGAARRDAASSAAWHGVAARPTLTPETGTLSEWWGRGERFVCFEIGHEQWAWACLQAGREHRQPAAGAGWDPVVQGLIAATPANARRRLECPSARPHRVWGHGRVTLLGDAAHPMGTGGGQGVSQALEDAVVLARCLSTGTEVVAGLRAYEEQRRSRASRQQALARRLDALSRLHGTVSCALRDGFITATWERVGLRGLRRDLDDPVESAAA